MTSFVPYLNIQTTLTPASTQGAPSKNVLLIGQRNTDGVLTLATGGYTQPNYYEPILLPAFQDGATALAYLSNFGIQSTLGFNFSLPAAGTTFPAPDTSTVVDSVTQLTWNTPPANFSALTDFALTGTLAQLSVNGTVRNAEILSGVAYLFVNGNPGFTIAGDSGADMTLTGTNNIPYPDPNASDPIALMVWDFYQTALSANNSPQGAPQAYISILSDRDSTINADPASIALVAPSSVSSKVGSTQTLTYPVDADNLGYLPTTAYGTTAVSQSTSLPTNSSNFVYYANSKFIRGSAAGAGLDYSLDGNTWTASNTTSGTFTSAFYNGTLFVATSAAGIYSSADGITWTVSNINSGSFRSVYFANTKWVALSTVGIYYSANGTSWTLSTGAATGSFNQAAFGAGTWIASCTVDLYASTDGITWAALSVSSDGFDAVTYADGLFVVGSDGSGTDGIQYSTDGAAFVASNIAVNSYKSIAFNGSDWVAASDAGLYYSPNGISWTLASGTSTHNYKSLAYGSSKWIAASNAGMYSSSDSVTWAVSNISTGTYNSVVYAASLFVSVGTTGIITSSNGTVWSVNNTATAIYGGYQISGINLIISLTDVSGTFTTSSAVGVVLDNALSAFDFVNNIDLNGAVLQFPINTLEDITTQQASFFDAITEINQDGQVMNGHYFTYGWAGNITSLPSQAATLPSPNNNEYVLVTYPYVYKFGDVPYDNVEGTVASGRFAAGCAYMIANGDAPYPALTDAVIRHFPVSSVYATTSYSTDPNGTGNNAIVQGWLPLVPNSQQVVKFLQSNTTMITLPNTTVPDTEFRYTHIWDCVRWLKFEVTQLFNTIRVLPNNTGIANISPKFIRQFRAGIVSILNTGERLGIVQNVALYENLVTVAQDPDNANQVDVYVPAQIIPQLNGANVLINIFSSLDNNFTTNQ